VPFWDNVEKYSRDGQAACLWRMRIACRIPKATHAHSEYVILPEFPLQQWLHQRVLMLRHMYIACVVKCLRFT
jgi:hypothetical protein